MTSPANIPQEIVDEIIQRPENDPNTLCNLCLVARSFLPRAQQILYRDITINLHSYDVPALSKWAVTAERAIEFFETLTTRNNALAEHVQRLYHHHYIRFSAYYWGLMKRSLRLMVNLQSLVLTSIPEPIIGFFNGCTFRLKNFDCDTLYNDFQTCREITRFFFSQPDIQSLDICGYTRPDEPFSGPHLPKLETLRGDSCSIENLLPQQPLVTNLSWALSFGERTIRLPTPRIASSLSNIHHFSLAGFSDRPDIGFLIPYLPSVRVLRLVGESSKISLADELALIPDLPKLRIFIWSAAPLLVYKNMTDKRSQYASVKRLFAGIRFLEKVYIDTPPEEIGADAPPHPKFDSPYYLCWEREKPEPTIVGFRAAVGAYKFVSQYQ